MFFPGSSESWGSPVLPQLLGILAFLLFPGVEAVVEYLKADFPSSELG